MERLELEDEVVEEARSRPRKEFPGNANPCPGSNLKQDDDVLWLGFAAMRVLWGYTDPTYCFCYCPDVFGPGPVLVVGRHFEDRAPADPVEEPLPIWPEEPQAMRAAAADTSAQSTKARAMIGPKEAVRRALESLPPAQRKEARKKIRALRRDLVDAEPA